jgi:hydroxyacylglutathione hydrolase
MRGSLEKLRGLPPETLIFCAHEYTLANLRFARLVEPKNSALSAFLSACESKRANDEPTVPSRISDELACNPFLRWDSPEVRETLKTAGKLAEDTADGIFTAVREWKNTA